VGGLGSDGIVESTAYLTEYVYTTDGAIHYTGDGVNETVGCGPLVPSNACPETPTPGNGEFINTYPATDGSGYSGGRDPEGNTYTASSVADPNGNKVTWSSSGWTDSMGRFIPGGNTGPGANEFPTASGYTTSAGFFDLIPGTTLSQVPSECPSGTSAARSWTVPASTSNGGSATYYLCYSYLTYQTAFNLSAQLMAQSGITINSPADVNSGSALGQALLLTAVVLPDLKMYTFQYDQYLSLSQIDLPSGGTITYTWQNVTFRPMPYINSGWGGIATPVSRALASRTVSPGYGQPAITTTYEWNITTSATSTGTNWNQGVAFPAYSVVTDSNGNDTEYTLGGADDYGQTWNDYVITGVTSYSGCSPHHTGCSGGTGTRLKAVTNGLTAVASGGAPSVSPAYVPLFPALPPTKVTQNTTHLPASGGDKLARVRSALTPAYGSCTIYTYPLYYFGAQQSFPSSTQNNCFVTGQIASTATYDYGAAGSGSPGSLLKTESITYAWQNSSSVLSANMLNLVAYDTITDGSGSWAAETDRCYDGSGNNTSVQKLASQPTSHSCTSPPANALITSTTFSSGVVQSTKDARQYTTTMSNFVCNSALPQTVTLPDGNQTKYLYDCNTGKVTSVQDQNDINNSVATTYTYADPLNRVTAANYPDGGSVSVNYHGDALPLTMTVTKASGEAAGANVTTKIYDGLARIYRTQTSDGLVGVSDTLYADTNYDNLGRVYTESNPYRSSSDATYGLTTTQYDALGRKLKVTNPDNTYQTFSYDGSTVTFTDESSNPWKKTTDALGRLIQVLEPSSTSKSATMPTNYSYDALGSLKAVNQVGLSSTDTARNRSFSYDAFSRLLAANNPEKASGSSGATQTCSGASGKWTNCYSYDADGNVLQETDNRGISIYYAYDQMSRLYSKSYSTGEPSACYQYNTPISAATDKRAKGYLTLEWTQTGSCPGPSNPQTSIPSSAITSKAILQHDSMGRIWQEQVCPLGVCSTAYEFNYTYDLAGNVTSSNNGLPAASSSTTAPAISWGATYDAANRLSLVSVSSQPWSDSVHPSVLFEANQNTYSTFGSAMPYDPFGHLVNGQLGLTTSSGPSVSGIDVQRQYNNRGRILNETDTAPSTGADAVGTISVAGSETVLSISGTPGTGSLSITGSDGSQTVCTTTQVWQPDGDYWYPVTTCNSVPDTGTISVTMNGFKASASYGSGTTDASLAASLATALNGSGSPVSATYTSGSTTNLLPNSAQIGGSNWSPYCGGSTGMVLDTSSVPAPDGSQTATQFTMPSSYICGSSLPYGALTSIAGGLTTGATYTVSAWLRGAVGGEVVSLGLNDCTGTNFTLTTGWKRYSTTFSAISSGVSGCATGARGFQSIGPTPNSTYYIWGAQTEKATTQGPYVATTSGASTTTNNNEIFVSANTTGTSTNYPITISNGDFSISDPRAALSGGTNGVTVYDAGTATATISSASSGTSYTTAPISWGQSDTGSTVASKLASAINTAAGVEVTATPSGSSVSLISKTQSAAADYSVTVNVTDSMAASYPTAFSTPSFQLSATQLSGGVAPSTIYSYQVPSGGYTPNGNIAAINDSVTGNWSYNYDPLNRLQTASASSGTYSGQHGCWSYDSFGNRTAETFQTPACPTTETSVTATTSYNANNQFSGTTGNSGLFHYDNSGDVTTDTLNSYLYDGEGRLCAVKNSNQSVYQYVYDAEGNRVAKATLTSWPTSCLAPASAPGFAAQTLYLRGSGSAQTTELNGAGLWQHTNYFGGPAPMATWSSSGSWAFAFHITDQLGSRRVLASAQGAVLETCQNLPYGNGETCAATPTEHLFTGKERDAESGNDFFEARYYTSTAGRFMSPDWSAKAEPVPYASLGNPQSLNLYAYVRNNPISGMDPDGHDPLGNFNALAALGVEGGYDNFNQLQLAGVDAQANAWTEQQAENMAATGMDNPEGDGSGGTGQQQLNFSSLAANYPGHDAYPTDPNAPNSIWSLIGGHVAMNAWTTDADGNKVPNNTCAIRMSYDLNHSGLSIPKGKGTVSGADGKQYFLRVADLQKFLTGALGEPQRLAGRSFAGPGGSTGIISFNIPFQNATGHFTLWNGSNVADPKEPYGSWPAPTSALFWGIK
jgi:RHS repeat-associated protein